MSEREIKCATDAFDCHVRVHHDTDGVLTAVQVSINGCAPILRYPEPGDSVGDLFNAAFEAAKVLMLTRRIVNPLPGEPA